MTETVERPSDGIGSKAGAVALLLLGSGLCSLVYQTVWLREMRGVFGSSTSATAAVIGIFMGGLGLGGFLLGRVADRSRNPLRLYSNLEIGVAISALATIPLGRLVELLYFSSGGSPALGLFGATLLRLLLAVLLLGVPTVLMGGTLPAVARAVVGQGDLKRRAIALLYGMNTLGAVAGTIASTFFSLERFGNQKTLVMAALLNLLVAIGARAMSRREGFERDPEAEERDVAGAGAEREASALFTWSAAAVAGFSFLLLELVWYRLLAPILGGSTFTFGLILAMALLGIGLGGILYALIAGDRPVTLRFFAVVCGLEALAIVVPFALGDRLAILAALARSLEALGFGGNILAWSIICAIVVVPAALVSGFQFPALIALAGRGSTNVGVEVGRVYAFNTLGAIAGSLAGGFGLMPLLTTTGCWKLAGWMMIVLCAATAVSDARRRSVAIAGPAIAAVAALLLLVPTGPTAAWRHAPIGAGRVTLSGMSRNEIIDWQRGLRRAIRWEVDGVESSVALDARDGFAFIVNGKSDGHSIGDAGTQIMSGMLGAMLHPKPTRSLVIGLGTGSTAGWLGKVPGMERVDVAELEPAIRRVALDCAPVNQNVLEQKNVHVFYGDARELLLVTRERYDVIFSEPSNPYRAGIAGLFTTEFYRAVSERLDERGIFLQWVQAYEIDGRTLETILRTLQGVFPHVQMWATNYRDILLVATREPLPVDADQLRARVASEPYRSALRQAWKTDSVEGMLAHMVADDSFVKLVAGKTVAPINTDDTNVVEFGFARSVGASRADTIGELVGVATAVGMRDKSPRGRFDAALVQRFRMTSPVLAATDPTQNKDLARAIGGYREGQFAQTVSAWEMSGLEPLSHYETVSLAEALAHAGDARCLAHLEKLRGFDPVDALLVEGIYRWEAGETGEALDLLARGFELQRELPWATRSLVTRATEVAETMVLRGGDDASVNRLAQAFSQPFALGQNEERRRRFLFSASARLERAACGPRTVASLALIEPNTPWQRDLLKGRALCYASLGHPLAQLAADELERFDSLESQPFGLDLTSPK
ncbi:MAG: fused MFS/spermidine synthase [Thermoanaerobaculia bacterium]|nr:fused MFS/spermidine synthase [Thermoanaerobaculia bacterium]